VAHFANTTTFERPPEIIQTRRARHVEYRELTLPRTWTGMPDPSPLRTQPVDGETLQGLPVSGTQTIEAPARVITDPSAEDPLEPGEILVCDTADPSWVSLFVNASALVIDIGGALSHGAIVAGELGIPAVVNTGTDTRVIRTGDHLRVNGASGKVEILTRSEQPADPQPATPKITAASKAAS
jgi:phosphoenolpyruvate synthase/pyruvate phosphate dikinase